MPSRTFLPISKDFISPCGEGAGYAGGILSAAADGCRMAEQVCLAIAREG